MLRFLDLLAGVGIDVETPASAARSIHDHQSNDEDETGENCFQLHRRCGPSSILIAVRHGATRIVLPTAIGIVESRGIANRSGISVRRVNADAESKAGTIISSAAVIPPTAVERTATVKVAPARCSKGVSSAKSARVSSAKSARVSAAVTSRERRYRTRRHRNHESDRSDYLSNQIQNSFFHDDLQRLS
jgi:hypothetical protein